MTTNRVRWTPDQIRRYYEEHLRQPVPAEVEAALAAGNQADPAGPHAGHGLHWAAHIGRGRREDLGGMAGCLSGFK